MRKYVRSITKIDEAKIKADTNNPPDSFTIPQVLSKPLGILPHSLNEEIAVLPISIGVRHI